MHSSTGYCSLHRRCLTSHAQPSIGSLVLMSPYDPLPPALKSDVWKDPQDQLEEECLISYPRAGWVCLSRFGAWSFLFEPITASVAGDSHCHSVTL